MSNESFGTQNFLLVAILMWKGSPERERNSGLRDIAKLACEARTIAKLSSYVKSNFSQEQSFFFFFNATERELREVKENPKSALIDCKGWGWETFKRAKSKGEVTMEVKINK